MEDGRMMLLHSAVIGVVLYLFMVFVLGQRSVVAENRSILLAALILVYMILFGHGLPGPINRNLLWVRLSWLPSVAIHFTNHINTKLVKLVNESNSHWYCESNIGICRRFESECRRNPILSGYKQRILQNQFRKWFTLANQIHTRHEAALSHTCRWILGQQG